MKKMSATHYGKEEEELRKVELTFPIRSIVFLLRARAMLLSVGWRRE